MPRAMGTKAYLGWGQETTWGTAATINKYIPIVSESIRLTRETIRSESLRNSRSVDLDQVMAGAKRVEGDFVTELYVKGLLQLFKHALGSASSQQQSGTSAYLHTFTLGDLPTGLTIAVGRDFSQFKYVGCKINQLRIEGRENQFLRATWSIIGKDETIESVTTPTFPSDNTAFVFWNGSCTIDSNSTNIRSFEITINNNLLTDRYFMNQTLYDLPEQVREVTGTITMDPSTTEYQKFVNFTPASITITATRRLIVGSYYEQLTITIPKAVYTGETPTVGGPGAITMNVPFTAYASGATAELTITIQNTETSV